MHSSILLILFAFVPLVHGIDICPTREVTMAAGEITSPNYPNKYLPDTNCTLTIKQPLDTKFTFSFIDLHIEGEEDVGVLSCFDSLFISGGDCREYCGKTLPADFTPGLNVVKLKMESDGIVENKGFNLSFTSVKKTGLPPAVSVCPTRAIMPSTIGRVHSPGFPADYDPNLNCQLTLSVPSHKEVEVMFNYRDIEFSTNCANDKLTLAATDQSTFICGQGTTSSALSRFKQGDLSFDFVTDGSVSGSGFQLTYKLIDKPVQTGCRKLWPAGK